MRCPHCSSPMKPMTYEGVHIHTCNGCGGEFVGPAELAAIVQTREMVFGDHLKGLYADHEPAFGIPDGEPAREFACPACKGAMQLINYAGDTGIAVDRCGECGGVWLDHKELEKVQLIVERWTERAPAQLREIAGELDAARRRTAEMWSAKFSGSRFSFVNAMINRLLDLAA